MFILRYWYGFDSTSKDLYGANGEAMVSRPIYDGMQTLTLESYTCVDHMSGLFWKGCVGGGLLTQGNLLTQCNLHDENFLPAISPYTSTDRTL